ncbi:ELM1/GtrOC1 family putative glycosyltransferase [Nevskia ramosa]|uniref:ELM1/GtrOC1 family putative glycosyltransferase n=1 Tax=Nevskia ramosa TaxID=64002 RepID=UPI000407E407|nr:ELM1/GtrOC1 family putative glycosyltransferase [Nevskia ramosa]
MTDFPSREARARQPLVWLMIGSNAGETGQLRVLGRALGWPCIEKSIAAPGLAPAIGQAWPDLVISFGKSLRAATKVVARSDRRTRLVHLGRPRWVRTDAIDLIIPMPQDRLPAAANVLPIRMSFNDRIGLPDAVPVDSSAGGWQDLPRPWTVVLVGGATRHFRFDEDDACKLGTLASQHAQAGGGSLLVTTSPRTGAGTAQALRSALQAPHFLYEYRRGDDANPLPAWLQQADDLIVTGDSASMLAEAWRTGRPVQVLPLAGHSTPTRRWLSRLQQRCPPALYAFLLKRGIVAAPVDLASWIAERIAEGDFAVLGQSDGNRQRSLRADDDLARAVARIKSLLLDRL